MIQEIFAWIVVAGTLAFVIYRTFRKPGTKKTCDCDNCSGCDLKDIMKRKNEGSVKR